MYSRWAVFIWLVAQSFFPTLQACMNGDLRLVSSVLFPPWTLGRVGICLGGEWGTVCNNQWDQLDAAVVCKQLGGYAVYGTAFSASFFIGPGTGPIFLDQVDCTGLEQNLISCSHSGLENNNCTHTDDAVVACYTDNGCVDGEVQLVGTRSEQGEGIVDVCFGGGWGSICDDMWDSRDAEVVCNQLGFTAGAYGVIGLNQLLEPKPVFLDRVDCSGKESSLVECRRNSAILHVATRCFSHTNDAGVVCRASTCVDGEVTLVGSAYRKEGRVEICFNNTWYAVCGDDWTQTEAEVVCSQLGYSPGDSLVASHFGQGRRTTYPGVFNCSEDNANLTECLISLQSQTSCKHVAAVQCEAPCHKLGIISCTQCVPSDCEDPTENCKCGRNCLRTGDCCRDMLHVEDCFESPPVCNDRDVRLVGGSNGTSGRVELCLRGNWGTVCDFNSVWNSDNAAVVCRQLGFPIPNARVLPSRLFGGEGPVYLEDVQCFRDDSSLLECHHHGVLGFHECGHQEILGRLDDVHEHDACIACDVECNDGELRLVDGVSNTSGRVELCQYGIWGSVCDDQWDSLDAAVVCRQLGFGDGEDMHAAFPFGESNGPILVHSVTCLGNEARLTDCPLQLHEFGICQHSDDAGVICGVEVVQPERCSDRNGIAFVEDLERIGSCESYRNGSEVCGGILAGKYVYLLYGVTQSDLDAKLDSTSDILGADTEECQHFVSVVLCNTYYSPCGTEDTRITPVTICPEECDNITEACGSTWNLAMATLTSPDNSLPMINCSRLAAFLPPVDTCCRGPNMDQLMATDSPGGGGSDETVVVTAVAVPVTVSLVLLLVAVCLVVMHIYHRIKIKEKRLKQATLDIEGRSVNEDTATTDNGVQSSFGDKSSVRCMPASGSAPNEDGPAGRLIPPCAPSPTTTAFLRKLPPHMLIPTVRLRLLDCIGQGEFGIVYKAHLLKPMVMRSNVDPQIVAVKTLKGCFNSTAIHEMLGESVKMKSFNHPNVLSLIGVCVDAGPTPYIILPYMSNGSLHLYLRKERDSLLFEEESEGEEDKVMEAQKRLLNMCSQVCKGMEYLAEKKFVHRDLAARNCMIDSQYIIKVSDFGLSEDLYAKKYFRQDKGSPVKLPVKWMAPECLTDGIFSEKTDVWSFGITCWEVFSAGKTPYPGVDPMAMVTVLETGVRMDKPFNVCCPHSMYEVMQKCWCKSPDARPTFSELSAEITHLLTSLAGYLDLETITGIIREASPLEPDNDVGPAATLTSSPTSSLGEDILKKGDITALTRAIHLECSNSIIQEDAEKDHERW